MTAQSAAPLAELSAILSLFPTAVDISAIATYIAAIDTDISPLLDPIETDIAAIATDVLAIDIPAIATVISAIANDVSLLFHPESSGLDLGPIVGIITGVVGLMAIILVALLCCTRRRQIEAEVE
jgi:hypothetical protein